MPTTRKDIREWLECAKEFGATHMVVMCDTFDWDDYPVYVLPGENPREKAMGDMQKPMECYNMSMDLEEQIAEHRANNWD